MAERATRPLSIESLWETAGFKPNPAQREAILHADGPLYLTAGPGSGKTRVLLWRALNLIVFHDVKPEEIYLSTFTEKAALQLREGLQAYLGMVTNLNGKSFDLSRMYVGTVHSLCQHILTDRRFFSGRERPRPPRLLDELGQYFHLYRRSRWERLTARVGLENGANQTINQFFAGSNSKSRYYAVTSCIALFNRLSEECIDPGQALAQLEDPEPGLVAYLGEQGIDREGLVLVLRLYVEYCRSLASSARYPSTDFALSQQAALEALEGLDGSGEVFKHVIVDEYQDTNTVQERLFFKLASGHKNICVVGDDDQALYRFRGATVENFVQFSRRCERYLGVSPRRIPLSINYRSLRRIVDFYSEFMECCDWSAGPGSKECYRVVDKKLRAHRADPQTSVVASRPGKPVDVYAEIAALVRRLLDEGKVSDPNQVAFLFPSVKYRGQKNTQVRRMQEALEAVGFKVYAPRAGRFLEVDEALDVFGLLGRILGVPRGGMRRGGDYRQFCEWLDAVEARTEELMEADPQLAAYVGDRQGEMGRALADYRALCGVVERRRWRMGEAYDIARMKRALYGAPGLSDEARQALSSVYFDRIVRRRAEAGNPFDLKYVIRRAAALDWSVLDLFYQLCGFGHFRAMFELAESGEDEGPICNLALISQYLSRYTDEYWTIITPDLLEDNLYQRVFFLTYLYALFRLGESEYEDAEDPFPKGRIPFLTIHQSKGLEFPVVVLANPRKNNRGPQQTEILVRPFWGRDEGEPLGRVAEFDIMRMFYVALSRAKNLLVLAHLKSRGNYVSEPFKTMLDDDFPRIPELDLDTLPEASSKEERLPKPYSYTADYLQYNRCPRRYMVFRRYGFAPSRSETMFFGSLVHRTLEDLHNHLISRREPS